MYTTKPEYEFKIFDLELDRYEFFEEPTYKNGEVTFKMELFLNGDKDYLGDVQQFGYYIRYANVIDYKQVKYLSSIFASTPATYELKIPKEGFLGNTMNYATFEARPNIPYYIGVYVVLKNGKIITFDEEVIEGLVYDHKPSLTFTSASVGGTSVLDEDDGDFYYATDVSIAYQVNGSFWFDNLNFGLPSDVSDKVGLVEIENGDGLYKGDYYWTYWSSSSSIPFVYLIGNLTNGGTFVSDNMLTFHGMPISSVYITGNGSSTMQQSNTLNVRAKTRSSFFTRK
jgi:hypothetical protein